MPAMNNPTARSDVPTGRRMKGSETLMRKQKTENGKRK
jgi:hypothetical protein